MNNHKLLRISFSGYVVLLFVFLMGPTFAGNKSKNLISYNFDVTNLKCEYATNPMGLDVVFPQLSWQIESEKRAVSQAAYQIIVSDSQAALSTDDGNIWDSGKIKSQRSSGIKYDGKKLKSRIRYYWKVKIWDQNNIESEWSSPAFFEMGLLDQDDWAADWIGDLPKWTGRVQYFRKSFSVVKEIQKARFYIAGIGYYELFINGNKIGDHVLDPGITSYNKKILYSTYNVEDFLLRKDNVIGITVAPGWYGVPKLRGQLEITFADGSDTTIVTSGSSQWSVSVGPIIQSCIYDGEIYDAREEISGWNSDVNIHNKTDRVYQWKNVVVVNPPGGIMVAQKQEPIKVVDVVVPELINEPKAGVYIFDTRENMAGWASIQVEGDRGSEITLKFAESLYPDGTVNQENLRSAAATDKYILKGAGKESWEPSFTYHGFRYIQVEGFPYRPTKGDIKVKKVRSAVAETGRFSCSNELMNRIHQMVQRTEASNLHSIPTDCPQRDERMGWLNDMTVRIDQALYNFDLSRFYAKWIDDVEDTQKEEGSIADTAPFHWGFNPADPVSASYLLLALQSYNFYGNEEIIREHYKGLKAWVDYLYSRTENGIVGYSRWGDWSPPLEYSLDGTAVSRDTPGKLMSTGYLYYCAKIISQMATILEMGQDIERYNSIAQKTRAAYNNKFWNEETGGYGSNNQACNSFSLFLGVVDSVNIQSVVENLVNDVIEHDHHLTTGNLCTKYVLEILSEYGYQDIAYKIVTQETYPSWGYMLANGATTLWERWELKTGGAMNSHNHPMLGSVDSWFYKYVLGILPDISNPGFEKFSIHPLIFNELNFAEGEYISVKGKIKCAWEKRAGFFNLHVTIPENSVADVYIPTKNIKTITENDQRLNKRKEIKFLGQEGEYAICQVGSGDYNFKSKCD